MEKYFWKLRSSITNAIGASTLCLLAQFQVSADTLQLANGDRISGKLIGIAGELVEFETDYAGVLRVEQGSVAAIVTDDEFMVFYEEGERDATTISPTIDVASIQMARKETNPLLGTAAALSNEVDLSASYSTGNSSTQLYLLSTESLLTQPKAEHVLKTSFNFDVAEGNELKNQINVNYKTRNFFRDKWFYALNADAFRDPLKSVDLRLAPTVGLGYRFWDHTYSSLTAETGIAAIIEQSDDLKTENPAWSWELDYSRRLLGGRLEAFHEHRVLAAFGDGLVLDSSNGLKYALIENVNLNFLATFKHDTDVPEGVAKTDVTYLAGVGLTF